MQEHWYTPLVEAIPQRHSVRSYLAQALPEEQLAQINHFSAELKVPFEHQVKCQVFQAEPGKKLYNNGINPIDNIALISETDLLSVSKVGFVGQLIMLYAVSLGISTCWFGHYKLAEVGKYIAGIATPERLKESTLGYGYGRHIDVGERVICCIPIGHKQENSKRLVDFVAAKILSKRKPLADLVEDKSSINNLPPELMRAFDLARMAPSAGNMQMWRFGITDNFRTLTVAKPVGYKHFKWEHPDVDIGIAAAQLWLGLLNEGYQPQIELTQDADRALWRLRI